MNANAKMTYKPNATTAFAKLAGFQEVADLMNLFLSCEDCEELTDDEVEDAMGVFETLCDLRPECIKLAQGSAYVVTIERSKTEWIARGDSGSWRSKCDLHFADSPQKAIAAMFHANEVLAVRGIQALITTE